MQKVYRVEDGCTLDGSPAIEVAARVLREGGLALIPTETVYGLAVAVSAFSGTPAATLSTSDDAPAPLDNGCPVPAEGSGFRRIFDLKRRDLTQTVPWLVGGASDLDVYGRNIDVRTRALAQSLWPGALTLIVPAAPNVPKFMCAADGTVALRASASPVVAALVRACGCPLACTSANTHGVPAPASFDAVEPRILAGVDIALDAGATPCQDASTIVSFPSGTLKIVRQGALPASAIDRALTGASAPAGAGSARGR